MDVTVFQQQSSLSMFRSYYPAISPSLSKAILLGSLYLLQSAPKGYLKYLHILLRERNASLQELSSLTFLYIPELFKPFFSLLLDSSLFLSLKSKKYLLVSIHVVLAALLLSSTAMDYSNIRRIGLLFFGTNLLMAVHDAAVDGLAVQILSPSEQPFGAFGQYAGYKTAGKALSNDLDAMRTAIVLFQS